MKSKAVLLTTSFFNVRRASESKYDWDKLKFVSIIMSKIRALSRCFFQHNPFLSVQHDDSFSLELHLYFYMCRGLNSQCFPMVGMVINLLVGVYRPIVTILHSRWDDHSPIQRLCRPKRWTMKSWALLEKLQVPIDCHVEKMKVCFR